MRDLISRIESATGPDRELDADIAKALGAKPTITVGHELLGNLREVPAHSARYTASLDAALSLVPEAMAWTLGQNVHHRYWVASINALNEEGAPYSRGMSDNKHGPALALCAAALRARLAMQEAGDASA